MPKRKAANNLVVDFAKLTVALLKKECESRKIDNTGKKADLVQRLQDYEKNSPKNIKLEEPEAVEEEEEKEMTMKDKLKALAEKEKRTKTKSFKIDSFCNLSGAEVVEDYDCMLNQTNIGANNNKFYVIQLLRCPPSDYFVWNRWGRVGESGANALKEMSSQADAEKEFKKKFRDKTKNSWDDRANFTPANGKYTMIDMDSQDSQDIEDMEEKLAGMDSVDGPPVGIKSQTTQPCTLPTPTQNLIKLIFDNDMFKEAMAALNLDVKKMPLGKLSKTQIAKGFEVLEEMESVLSAKSTKGLQDLTSRFYTLIPHNFGRNRPPLIGDLETLQKKMDMLLVLGDIIIAQTLQKTEVKKEETEVPHPLDVNYGLLNCGLTHIDKKSDTYKIIDTYVENTKCSYGNVKLLDVWEVDRAEEDKRFAEYKDMDNRKLLWHGTNVAVVVAILKSGLRIMPHSGGRVGRGIYFASEHAKSAAYVGCCRNGTGIMFLNEVALGDQHIIRMDDSSLRKAPQGFDSVLAQGTTEPDPSKDTKISLDGNDIIVPQGKPISTKGASQSSFSQSEYLVYKESQCRIRYLLKFKLR